MRVMRANPPHPALGPHRLRVMRGRLKRANELKLATYPAFFSTGRELACTARPTLPPLANGRVME